MIFRFINNINKFTLTNIRNCSFSKKYTDSTFQYSFFLNDYPTPLLSTTSPNYAQVLQSELDLSCFKNDYERAERTIQHVFDHIHRHTVDINIFDHGLFFRYLVLEFLNNTNSYFPKIFSNNKYFNHELLIFNKLKSNVSLKVRDFDSLMYQIYPYALKGYNKQPYFSFQNFFHHNMNHEFDFNNEYFDSIDSIFQQWEDNINDRFKYFRDDKNFPDSIYLSSISSDILSKILLFNIHEILANGFSSISVNTFLRKLSKMIFDSYSIEWNSKYFPLNTFLYNNGVLDAGTPSIILSPPIWPNSLLLKISSTLMNIVLATCPMHNGVKVITYETLYQNGRYSTVLSLSPQFVAKLREYYLYQQDFKIKKSHLPTQEGVNKWVSLEGMPINGVTRSLVKGNKYLFHYIDLKQSLHDNSMEKVKSAIDYLGEIPWNINRYILNVLKNMIESGIDFSSLGIPIKPDMENYDLDIIRPTRDSSENYTQVLIKHRYKVVYERSMYAEKLQLWNKLIKTISIADNYGGSNFYIPYEMDFRGRLYPTPMYFSLCDSDIYRSFLMFGEKKKIGIAGLRWLKIHIANMYGGTRLLTFDERVEFCDENLAEIKESVNNPSTTLWWKNSKNPFQLLAACNELCNALKLDNPEEYTTGLPIHIDGCCNGIQHYAAMTRSESEASLVNMDWEGKINDLYTTILNDVQSSCHLDILTKNDKISETINKYIDRDIIKCVVVGFSYGITLEGTKKLISIKLKKYPELEWNKRLEVAELISSKTLEITAKNLKSTTLVKDWLEYLAKLYVYQNKPVHWKTPLNLSVYQPYFTDLNAKIACPMGNISVQDDICCNEMKIDSDGQVKGFPANFIHSLDATHMMMTAQECKSRNIFFSSVHDSYWTHPCCVDNLNDILRNKFCQIYSTNILDKLLSDSSQYLNIKIENPPPRGNFDINSVKDSPYFFS